MLYESDGFRSSKFYFKSDNYSLSTLLSFLKNPSFSATSLDEVSTLLISLRESREGVFCNLMWNAMPFELVLYSLNESFIVESYDVSALGSRDWEAYEQFIDSSLERAFNVSPIAYGVTNSKHADSSLLDNTISDQTNVGKWESMPFLLDYYDILLLLRKEFESNLPNSIVDSFSTLGDFFTLPSLKFSPK